MQYRPSLRISRKVPTECLHESWGILLIRSRSSLLSRPLVDHEQREVNSPLLSSLLIQGRSQLHWRCFQDESRRRTLWKIADASCCLGQRAAAARAHQWTPLALDLGTSHLAAIVSLHVQLPSQFMQQDWNLHNLWQLHKLLTAMLCWGKSGHIICLSDSAVRYGDGPGFPAT